MVKSRLLGAVGIVAVVGGIVGVVAAQTPASPAFDAVSVKPNITTDGRGLQLQFLPGGRLVIRNVPLGLIVAAAYNLPIQSPRITGGPEWARAASERYDIEARAADGAIPPGLSSVAREDIMRRMLQSLLADRFKMQIRRNPTEQPVYVLVVAKGGPKLQKSKTQEKDCGDSSVASGVQGCHNLNGGQGRGLHGEAVSIEDVALFVQNWTDLPVLDKTGLTGLYNIQTDGWAPMRPQTPPPDGSDATPQRGDAGLNNPVRQTLSDVMNQLGLRMVSQRAVVDLFVIDHVEHPTEN
jgi:uncharacterized protein (TIGR03435 family)